MTDRQNQIITIFKLKKSYTETAKVIGRTRQYIQYVIMRFVLADTQLKEIVESFSEKNKRCSECLRLFTKHVKHSSKGRCSACDQYIKRTRRVSSIRQINYPKYCLDCGIETIPGERVWSRCVSCASNYRYQEKGGRERNRANYVKNREHCREYNNRAFIMRQLGEK